MSFLLLLLVALIFNGAIGQQYEEWKGTPLDQLIGKKIRILSLYNAETGALRTPPLWLFSSPDWYWWSRNVIAGTINTSKSIDWRITKATPVEWTSNAASSYNYKGWQVNLVNDAENSNAYYWQTNVQTGTGAPNDIIFAHTTYTNKVLAPPYIYLVKPDQYYPYGLTGGGETALLSAGQPIGHFGWDTENKHQRAQYKIYVEVSPTAPGLPVLASDEIRIWSCSADGINTAYYDLATIQYYARTATEFKIRSRLDPSTYVSTSSISVLDSLRLGKTVSFGPTGSYSVPAQWSGPMVDKLWNSCGSASAFTDIPYWACNNGAGLHLNPTSCRWDLSKPTPGGLEIIIKRKLDEFIPLYRCTTDTSRYSLFPLPSVKAIGKTADTISIYTTNKRTMEYVNTVPNSYALASLANGMTLSYKTDNTYADVNGWTGTKTANLWNSCGNSFGFLERPYWACNNGDGLHLVADNCRWTLNQPVPDGGITVAVKPKTIAPYRLVRIFGCTSASKKEFVYSIEGIKKLAALADGITIMSSQNVNEYVTTASPNSYALASLRAGLSLSWTTTSSYAVVNDWVGTMTDRLWNSCGSQVPFTTAPYWACNNNGGLHLNADSCSWNNTASTPAGGIGVYLHLSASAINQAGISYEDSETVVSLGSETEQSALSPGALIGIAGGSVAGISLLILIVIVVVKVRKGKVQPEHYERML